MRLIRLVFVALMAVILLGIALANRGPVTVKAMPASLDQYFGTSLQITLPLFLIIFLAILCGLVVGFVWEWLREAHIRSAAARRSFEVERLEREVGALRDRHNAPKDDVLAILDRPRGDTVSRPAPAAPAPAPGMPARR
ncbi:MAG: LapA family protein [Paracoccus sp. (in: a-proteobacteria)]|nr:LapA family protein [Paracoccus sp. (in: a-proteobacteria)]